MVGWFVVWVYGVWKQQGAWNLTKKKDKAKHTHSGRSSSGTKEQPANLGLSIEICGCRVVAKKRHYYYVHVEYLPTLSHACNVHWNSMAPACGVLLYVCLSAQDSFTGRQQCSPHSFHGAMLPATHFLYATPPSTQLNFKNLDPATNKTSLYEVSNSG